MYNTLVNSKQQKSDSPNLVASLDWLQFYCVGHYFESRELSEQQVFLKGLFPELTDLTPDNKFQRFPCNLAPVPLETTRYNWGSEVIIIDDSLALQYTGHGTRNHQFCYNVILNGEHVGEIGVKTISAVYDPNWIDFRLLNHVLYRDWYNIANEVLLRLELKIKHITRVDIAVDTSSQIAVDTLNRFAKDEISTSGSYHLQKHYKRGRELNCLSIGKLQSDKCLKIYNKSEELKVSNKRYIYDYWINAKLTTPESETPIWRYEVRLKRAALERLEKFEPDKLTSPKYLLQLFNTMALKMLDFRENEDKPTKSGKVYSWHRKKVKLFNDVLLQAAELMPTRKAIASNGIYRLLQAAKADFTRYMLEKEAKYLDTGIFTYLKAGRLGYFQRSLKRIVNDIALTFADVQVKAEQAIVDITKRIEYFGLDDLTAEREYELYSQYGYKVSTYQMRQNNYHSTAGGLPLLE